MQPLALNIEDELNTFARGAPALTPSQHRIAADLSAGLSAAELATLRVSSGMGRTTVLQYVHAQTGGAFLAARQLLSLLTRRSPEAIEEAFLEILNLALDRNHTVFVDDLHLLNDVALVVELLDEAAGQGKKFVVAVQRDNPPAAFTRRALVFEIDEFSPEDYACIARHYLGNAAQRLNMDKVHRFAPTLSAYQIKHACLWLGLRYAAPDTDSLIEYLGLASPSR